MKEVFITDKQEFLNKEYPFGRIELTEKRYCLHCGEVITVGDYKVFEDETKDKYIYCPNAPECNGTIIDWMPENFKQ